MVKAALLAGVLLTAGASSAAVTVYSDRQAFRADTGPSFRDGYEDPAYQHVMTDAAMSAVQGETRYFTYGGNVTDYNNVMPPGFGVGGGRAYCSLCYGSFRLHFEAASLATGGGVYGVGVDITSNSGDIAPFKYQALVTFASGQTEAFELPYVVLDFPIRASNPQHAFWGITSSEGVASVDFVSHASSGPERTYFIIDNLTLAAAPVPSPPAAALMLAGLGALGGLMARRRRDQGSAGIRGQGGFGA